MTRAPTKPAKRDSKKQPTDAEARLTELVDMVLATAEMKGWEASVSALDEKNFRYATVSVTRAENYQEITAIVDITCDKRTSIGFQKTSFYNYGLSSLRNAIENEFSKIPWLADPKVDNKATNQQSDIALIERLLRRFHRLGRQLRHRHNNRAPLNIEDEYDVQDVLHGVLRGLFDDVRPEEHTPSYAGGSARMDFLLKSEKIVLETKFASAKLRDKQIGEQLLVDISRYQSHPDCQYLICFVYDPSGFLKNPSGLEVDLSKVHGRVTVKVIVVSN